MMPKQQEMEIPLLTALDKLGGKARPQDVYATVTKLFPALTDADLAEQLQSGGNRWTNRIQWVRQRLVERGEMESPSFGIWAITATGLARLRDGSADNQASHSRVSNSIASLPPPAPQTPPSQNFQDTVYDYRTAFKLKLLQQLVDLSPGKFEEFAGHLLKGYGFQKVVVTGRTGDGGIDGHGEWKIGFGLAVVKAAFQCKKWQAQVPPHEVQAFRGAIQGKAELGFFFATSTFSRAAQAEADREGVTPIILFDGEQIAQIMIEKGVGVKRIPVELYEEQMGDLFEDS
ncbi:MAG: restriction endonuclease [Terriglobales bacterium]